MAQAQPNEKDLTTFRLRRSVKEKLAKLAEATGRTQTYLAEEAIEAFCDLNQWQVQAIQEGIADADAGRVIPHEEVEKYWEMKFADYLDEKGNL